MQKIKRYLKITLMILLSVLLFAACSSSPGGKLDPKNPVTLDIWHYYNGAQKLAFDNMVAEFNDTVGREKGIIVEAYSQGDVNELLTKVVDAANKKVGSDDIPDIFAAYADTAYEVDQLGLVADLDPYFTEEELASYIPAYIEEGRFDKDQSLKIFPTAKSTEVLMLNKTDWDKFAQATGATFDDLATIEGLVDTAQKYYEWTDSLTATPDDGKTFFGRDAMANYIISGMKQLGHTIFDVGTDGNVTFDADKASVRKLWDNFYVPFINGYFGASGKFRSDDAKTGDVIAFVGSTSGAAYFPTEVTINDNESYPIEAAVLKNPCFADAERYSIQQGAGMVVTKSDATKEYAAAEFLKWFTDTQQNIDFAVSSGYLPVKQEANDEALITESFNKTEQAGNQTVLSTMLTSIDEVKNDTMYTNKAFNNGSDARKVLEYSMSDQAAADREQVLAQMAAGMSREDAVALYDTDENFETWYADFIAALDATQQAQ